MSTSACDTHSGSDAEFSALGRVTSARARGDLWIREELGLHPTYVRRLITISQHPIISNREYTLGLPASPVTSARARGDHIGLASGIASVILVRFLSDILVRYGDVRAREGRSGRWARGSVPEDPTGNIPEDHSGSNTGKVSGTAWGKAMNQAGFILE